MKTRFDTYDLVCSIAELQRLIGMRVNRIYDVDHRTYLIRLQRGEEKSVLLLESGNRIHTTAFEWPKNTTPSGFSMKLRKHLKNKRLESLTQVGADRIVDLQFGSGEAAYHVILEVYDRGNIVLTDYQLITLNILRPHTEGDKIRFAVREKYPVDRAHTTTMPSRDVIEEKLGAAKNGDALKKVLNPMLEFGSALIDHVLLKSGFQSGCKIGKSFNLNQDMEKLWTALKMANEILEETKNKPSQGYIIQKKESKPAQNGEQEFIMANVDFHPTLLEQYKTQPFKEFQSFDLAVDEYFSTMEGQKLDLKALAQERDALKKLENVRKDHGERLVNLGKVQEVDKKKAELITRNQKLVDNAILAVQALLATQMSWPDVETLVKEAQKRGDPIANAIKKLKLEINHITLFLSDPYASLDEDSNGDDSDTKEDTDDDKEASEDSETSQSATKTGSNPELAELTKENKETTKVKAKKTVRIADHTAGDEESQPKSVTKGNTNLEKKKKLKSVLKKSEDEEKFDGGDDDKLNPMLIDVDLGMTAFANATRYYDKKRSAAKKHQKTIESHGKALKSAERKTKQTLKEVQTIHSINKARKVYWFEKFYWFITSENYLVIGGRDQQQNEMIVKRYLRPGDLYVHADLTGASSVVLKNPSGAQVPPKSLAEAGTMAVCYSVAWEAKVVAGAYWVYHDQVSKTAPTGEYLTTGSFMIRGKKNYLPPCQLVMGLGFLFRLEEGSILRHQGERRVRTLEEDEESLGSFRAEEEKEIELKDDSDDSEASDAEKASKIGGDDAEVENDEEKNDSNKRNEEQSDESDSDLEEPKFPDTQIKLDLSGRQLKLLVDNKNPIHVEEHEEVVYLGDDKPVVLKPSQRKKSNQEKGQIKVQAFENQQESKQDLERRERRQKAKQKKIKEKYKNQDEEDRQIIMEMLKPNPAREARKMKKNKKAGQQSNQGVKKLPNFGNQTVNNPEKQTVANTGDVFDDDESGPAPEVDMLDQLTGKPVDEDELLFAVPVIAPYNAVLNYKFKVKLIPGTARRGKAAKTALGAFMKDKNITQREKDLLKAVKEENVARNIPGKVKISASVVQKYKK